MKQVTFEPSDQSHLNWIESRSIETRKIQLTYRKPPNISPPEYKPPRPTISPSVHKGLFVGQQLRRVTLITLQYYIIC